MTRSRRPHVAVAAVAALLLATLAALGILAWIARRSILSRLRPAPVRSAVDERQVNHEKSAFSTTDLFEKEGK